jgi:phosphatidylcholine synthase
MTTVQRSLYTLRAWAVHFYTSLGLICGLYAIFALMAGDARACALILALSNIIDATDGTLARFWNVKKWVPSFNGRKLDDITDYLNYTFIPIVFAFRFQLVSGWGIYVLGFVLILSAYGFCQEAAKTNDGYFTGFPNFWNVLVIYLYIFKFAPETNAIVMVIFALLILVPIKYISYSTKRFRLVTVLFSLLFCGLMLTVLWTLNNLNMGLVWASLICPAYYFLTSFYLNIVELKR